MAIDTYTSAPVRTMARGPFLPSHQPCLLALVKIIARQRAGVEMPLALWGRPHEGLLDHPDRHGVRVLARSECITTLHTADVNEKISAAMRLLRTWKMPATQSI